MQIPQIILNLKPNHYYNTPFFQPEPVLFQYPLRCPVPLKHRSRYPLQPQLLTSNPAHMPYRFRADTVPIPFDHHDVRIL